MRLIDVAGCDCSVVPSSLKAGATVGSPGLDSSLLTALHKGINKSLEAITLPSLPAIRHVVKDSLTDGALYFSEPVANAILDTVVVVR